MVSRRKSTAASEPAPPAEVSRGRRPTHGAPSESASGEGTPADLTVNVAMNEPPIKPARQQSPRRRTQGGTKGAKAEIGETNASDKLRQGNNSARGQGLELREVVQRLAEESRAQSAQLANEIQNVNAAVQTLSRGLEANDRRLHALGQDAQEGQTQLVQQTALLNDLIQTGQAVSHQEEEVWARIATVSEGFRQASDRLLERMGEQMLRLEGKVDDMTLRLGALEGQLKATQFALQENWSDLRSVGTETRAAAQQLEVVQRECQDTAEMLQVTREEIRAAQGDVEATGNAALEAAVQLDKAELRTQESQSESEVVSPSELALNGNKRRLGLVVDSDALVVEVAPGSPAAEAGLQEGDRITAVDGQPVDKGMDLSAIITQAETANEFTIEIMRGETTQLTTVRLSAETPSV